LAALAKRTQAGIAEANVIRCVSTERLGEKTVEERCVLVPPDKASVLGEQNSKEEMNNEYETP